MEPQPPPGRCRALAGVHHGGPSTGGASAGRLRLTIRSCCDPTVVQAEQHLTCSPSNVGRAVVATSEPLVDALASALERSRRERLDPPVQLSALSRWQWDVGSTGRR